MPKQNPTMRTYIIHFLTERWDSSSDEEIEVKALNIYGALDNFRSKGIVHKRVTKVEEKPNIIQDDTASFQ